MLTIAQRTFLKATAALYLISPLVSTKSVAGMTTSTMHEQQHHIRQLQADSVNADFKQSEFDIEIATSNDPGWTVSDSIKSFFDAATQKWSTVVTGDLQEVTTGMFAGQSTPDFGGFFGTCPLPESIDDLWICASAGDLGEPLPDGSIILAYARTLDLRAFFGLPVTGVIAFNNQAQRVISEETLLDVTIHEMGHVVSVLLLSQSVHSASFHCSLFFPSFIAWYRNHVDNIFSGNVGFTSLRVREL
jgi:hypothetical protein